MIAESIQQHVISENLIQKEQKVIAENQEEQRDSYALTNWY